VRQFAVLVIASAVLVWVQVAFQHFPLILAVGICLAAAAGATIAEALRAVTARLRGWLARSRQ
jgi:hypothetical protein